MEHNQSRVIAIYVLYNPDMDLLNKSISNVSDYVDAIWISDNSEKYHTVMGTKVIYKHLGGNKGIAFAQNRGIEFAIKNKFDWIIFFDQDSSFEKSFIESLYESFKTLLDNDPNAYGISPKAINRDSGTVLNLSYKDTPIQYGSYQYYPKKEIMSSASILLTDLFKKIGSMEEKLFIDCVDLEICFRGINMIGANFYVTDHCVLEHQLGEGDRKIFGRNCHIASPFRIYYEIRNVIWLLKRKYTPSYWKRQQSIKLLGKLLIYSTMVPSKSKYIKNMFRGLTDGLFYN